MRNLIVGIFSGILIAILIALGTGYFVLSSGIINPGADEPIPQWERWMAKTSIRAYLKRETPKTTNPVELTDKNLMDGIDVYFANCAVCHGDAKGNRTTIFNGLYKKPNIFAGEDWSQDKDGLVYWFIEHGVKLTGMPAYSKTLSEDDKWKLVLLIKNVKKLPTHAQAYWESKHLAEQLVKKPPSGSESE